MEIPSDIDRHYWTMRPDKLPVVMKQSWKNLLFLHWAVDPSIIQNTLPPGLHVDTFNGKAYVGVVPFEMHNVRPSHGPGLGKFSSFQELNLRTYVVSNDGCPGVWFYSLDAASLLAVIGARLLFHLPYFHARMNLQWTECNGQLECHYQSRRWLSHYGVESFDSGSYFQYRRNSELSAHPIVDQTSLEYFLVERYILFSWDSDNQIIKRGRVWHHPYQVTNADVIHCHTDLLAQHNFPGNSSSPEHVLFSKGVDVNIYPIESL